MRLLDRSVGELLSAFQSPDPTPGGGSAAALAGAVGASLLAMVAGLPRPRAAGGDEIARLAGAGARCAAIASRLAALMDRDSEAYDLVVAAFRLPKDTEDAKTARAKRIQEALRAATEIPLEVMRACSEAIEQAAEVAALGNHSASSDVRVGLELLGAGLRGARLNVEANLPGIKDEAFGRTAREEADRLTTASEAAVAAAVDRAVEGN